MHIYTNPRLHWWLSSKGAACNGEDAGHTSLGREGPLEEGMAMHSNTPA